jgi:hypothetical protein
MNNSYLKLLFDTFATTSGLLKGKSVKLKIMFLRGGKTFYHTFKNLFYRDFLFLISNRELVITFDDFSLIHIFPNGSYTLGLKYR